MISSLFSRLNTEHLAAKSHYKFIEFLIVPSTPKCDFETFNFRLMTQHFAPHAARLLRKAIAIKVVEAVKQIFMTKAFAEQHSET